MSSDEEVPEAIVEVDIDADPEDVWHALTTDEGLADWIGAGSTIGTAPGEDLHVHDVVTGQDRRGVLDEFTPGRRLGYTWWPETEPDRATRVAISLEPHPGGTRVTVIESRPSPVRARVDASVAAAHTYWAWRCAGLVVSMATRRCRVPALSI